MAEDKIYQQMSLWDLIYPKKIIDKPIRLIEFFAGIGDQHKALKQLTDQVESWKICEYRNNHCSICHREPLTKAPQSWCYIESEE